jgi:hypothetical protein
VLANTFALAALRGSNLALRLGLPFLIARSVPMARVLPSPRGDA